MGCFGSESMRVGETDFFWMRRKDEKRMERVSSRSGLGVEDARRREGREGRGELEREGVGWDELLFSFRSSLRTSGSASSSLRRTASERDLAKEICWREGRKESGK